MLVGGVTPCSRWEEGRAWIHFNVPVHFNMTKVINDPQSKMTRHNTAQHNQTWILRVVKFSHYKDYGIAIFLN